MDMAENLGKSAGVGESYADLHEEDGFAREMRELALSLVMQVPSRPQAVYAAPNDEGLAVGDSITIRLADQSDIETICALRCAQSVEYWEVAPSDDAYRLFCTQTEAYVRRNLNTHVYFALVEYDGSVVSMSGLEVVDRMPAIAMQGGAERAATIVSCYTLPQHRGRGYMGQMLSTWTAIAPMIGVDAIYLESRNPSMQLLALDEGYEYVSEKYRIDLRSLDCAPNPVQLEVLESRHMPERLPAS